MEIPPGTDPAYHAAIERIHRALLKTQAVLQLRGDFLVLAHLPAFDCLLSKLEERERERICLFMAEKFLQKTKRGAEVMAIHKQAAKYGEQ